MPRLLAQAIAGGVLVVALTRPAAAAQTFRGDVRALETNLPLPFSTAVLLPGATCRFPNASGVFAFRDLAPADYRVIVRAIGYRPYDTVITLSPEPCALHLA